MSTLTLPVPSISVSASAYIDFAITAAVANPVNTFTIAGDKTALFANGVAFTVFGSTGNNGSYTVLSSVFGTSTVITVNQSVASGVGDGTIRRPT